MMARRVVFKETYGNQTGKTEMEELSGPVHPATSLRRNVLFDDTHTRECIPRQRPCSVHRPGARPDSGKTKKRERPNTRKRGADEPGNKRTRVCETPHKKYRKRDPVSPGLKQEPARSMTSTEHTPSSSVDTGVWEVPMYNLYHHVFTPTCKTP